MKKTCMFAFSLLSLLLLSLVGIAVAYNADYTHTVSVFKFSTDD